MQSRCHTSGNPTNYLILSINNKPHFHLVPFALGTVAYLASLKYDNKLNIASKPMKNIDIYDIPLSLASSTKIISLSNCGGVLLITLCTVLSRVDHASL